MQTASESVEVLFEVGIVGRAACPACTFDNLFKIEKGNIMEKESFQYMKKLAETLKSGGLL